MAEGGDGGTYAATGGKLRLAWCSLSPGASNYWGLWGGTSGFRGLPEVSRNAGQPRCGRARYCSQNPRSSDARLAGGERGRTTVVAVVGGASLDQGRSAVVIVDEGIPLNLFWFEIKREREKYEEKGTIDGTTITGIPASEVVAKGFGGCRDLAEGVAQGHKKDLGVRDLVILQCGQVPGPTSLVERVVK